MGGGNGNGRNGGNTEPNNGNGGNGNGSGGNTGGNGGDELDALRKNIPGEPGKDYPIYSTSDLCKINPKNPGCGGSANGNGGDGSNGGGDGGNGNGGDIQPNNAPGGATGPDYSASGIAARKAALIAAISKNVPGLQLTPDDLVPISV